MARRDAASIEFMYEDRPARASKDNHNIRAGSPQRHHAVLSYSGQYLGQFLYQTSVERIESHSRKSLCHACRVPDRAQAT